MNLLMNSMLNLMILLILLITWVKSTINLKLLGKILRSLTENFRPKVTAITESKDVDSISVDELIGSLQSYELDLPKTSQLMVLRLVDLMMSSLL